MGPPRGLSEVPEIARSLRRVAPLLLLTVLVLAVFWRVLLTPEYSLINFDDMRQQWYPWFAFASASLARGELPLWNPHSFSGVSLVGEAQAGILYPPVLALAWAAGGTPVSTSAFSLFIVAHCVLAAWGACALARSLRCRAGAAVASGLLFGAGGYVMAKVTGQLNLVIGSAWLPVALWLWVRLLRREREWSRTAGLVAGSGAATGLGLLGGHIQPAIVTVYLMPCLAGLVLASRRRLGDWRAWLRAAALGVAVVAFALGLAAVQVIPSYFFSQGYLRWFSAAGPWPFAERVPYEMLATQAAATPTSLLANLVVPSERPLAEGGHHVGVIAVALAILGLARRGRRSTPLWLGGILAVALLLSLGAASMLHGVLTSVLPGLAQTRSPARMTLATSIALALLAGLGLDAVWQASAAKRGFLGGTLLVVAVAIGIAGFQAEPSPNELLVGKSILLGMLAVVVLASVRGRFRKGHAAAVAILIAQELYPALPRLLASAPEAPANRYAGNEVTAALAGSIEPWRVLDGAGILGLNFGCVHGVDDVRGYAAGMTRSYWELLNCAWTPAHPAFPLLACNWVVSRDPGRDCPFWEEAALSHTRDGTIGLYRNPSPYPRAWFTTTWEVVDGLEMARRLEKPVWVRPDRVLLNAEPPDQPPTAGHGTSPAASVRVVAHPGQRLAVELKAPGPGLLVLSETFDPGWRYRVDGRSVTALPAFGALTAVPVTTGSHLVEAAFVPRGFRAGLVLTALATLAVLLLAVRNAFRRRHSLLVIPR